MENAATPPLKLRCGSKHRSLSAVMRQLVRCEAYVNRVSGRNLSPYVAVVLTQPSTVYASPGFAWITRCSSSVLYCDIRHTNSVCRQMCSDLWPRTL